MKKFILIVIACSFLVPFTPVRAETVTKNNVQLRDDLILTLLFPLISKEIEKHYGKPKQYSNQQILQIKKLREGSFDFDVTVQVTTFEGAHNPPRDLVTITFSNYRSKIPGWQAIDFKSRRL
ncbi:DUF3888 domain-containing protein [Bacillus sp. BRMEA1]|uniref:DUF3888 domain-containing protein n=1 Tax=Neobacillus endophyticus TaxID=2738405 RepID=UPI00156582CD|nr:DUF3888 domain-containing protein [Neobacillus endophyticus]NRD79003.1 DUF3888 domain-containing protein [Neobacillus endophyticus]